MHVEPRGKYPGAKVHLNEKECEILLTAKTLDSSDPLGRKLKKLLYSLIEALTKLRDEEPALLDARTEDQIKAELITERDKAIAKLTAMEKGEAWNLGKSKA